MLTAKIGGGPKRNFPFKIEKKSGYGVRQKVSRYPARVLFPSNWTPIRSTQLPGHQESTQKGVKRSRLQTKYIDSPIQHLPDTPPLVSQNLVGLDILLISRSRSRSGIGLLYFPYIPIGIPVQAPGRSIPPSALLASRYLHKYGFTLVPMLVSRRHHPPGSPSSRTNCLRKSNTFIVQRHQVSVSKNKIKRHRSISWADYQFPATPES